MDYVDNFIKVFFMIETHSLSNEAKSVVRF